MCSAQLGSPSASCVAGFLQIEHTDDALNFELSEFSGASWVVVFPVFSSLVTFVDLTS
jgi:hypothetical protein